MFNVWKAFIALHVDALWARQEILLPAQGRGGGGTHDKSKDCLHWRLLILQSVNILDVINCWN